MPCWKTQWHVAVGALWLGLLCLVPGCGVEQAVDSAAKLLTKDCLKVISFGFAQHALVKKAYPTAYSTAPDGTPLLSWRVHLLPYLNQEKLYREFHLDEPWDSPHNKELIKKIPEFYQQPRRAEIDGKTTFLALVHADSAFTADLMKLRENSFRDGAANTIVVVEADPDRAVVWTKPEDIAFDPAQPFAGLGKAWDEGFHVATLDSKVHFIPNSASPEEFKALVTRDGGEPVNIGAVASE